MVTGLLLLSLLFVSAGLVPAHQDDLPSIPADTEIALAERGCIVKIVADGSVSFEGQTFDFDLGRIRTEISTAELRELISECQRINYFSLQRRYSGVEDGCPQSGLAEVDNIITTSITLNGKSKVVTRYERGCLDLSGASYPRELVSLERHIRAAVNLKQRS